ncbi:MAG: exo-alpha-sialidase [Fibrobacteres bacterium]|nr:exo-alpha-sialidase [Fibrobacterota bacterium]
MISLRRLFAIAGLMATGAQALTSTAYDWKSVVIGGGGFVDGFVFHPKAKGVLYARTDMGGAYRWHVASNSWMPITDWIGRTSDNMGVLAIALDAQDSSKVFLLTGKYTNSWSNEYGYVLGSSDGGRTFPLHTALHGKVGGNEEGRGAGERLAVDPNLGTVLYWAGSHWDSVAWGGNPQDTWRKGALWRSVDGGKTFDSLSAGPTGNGLFVILDPASGVSGKKTSRLFASFDSSNAGKAAIWASLDSGATWSLLAGQPANLIATHGTIAGRYVYFSANNGLGPNGVTGGQLWRYGLDDNSWKDVSPVKSATFGYGSASAWDLAPSRVAVSSLNRWNKEEVWVSRDTGATWTSTLFQGGTLDLSPAPWKSVRNPHWLASLQTDPFDTSAALFGTGYGVFRTRNLLSGSPVWAPADSNLEELVSKQMVSPLYGPPLVTAVGDQDGFRHVRLDQTPATTFSPNAGTSMAIDVAWLRPSFYVDAHNGTAPNGGKGYGSYSIDSGKTWTGFATQPAGMTSSNGGGTRTIATSADGANILWAPPGASAPYWSGDSGKTWLESAGTVPPAADIGYALPFSDKLNPAKMYLWDMVAGAFHTSTDGGRSFTKGATSFTGLPSYATSSGVAASSPLREGEIWLTSGSSGLHRSTNSGASFDKVSGVSEAYLVTLGKPDLANGKTAPAVYLWGKVESVTGLFRSTDSAASWTRINDDAHQYGTLHWLVADANLFGRLYLGTEGRGVIYGTPGSPSSNRPRLSASTPNLHREGLFLKASGTPAIQLYDLQGKSQRESWEGPVGQILDLAGLPRGLYFARAGKEGLKVQIVE